MHPTVPPLPNPTPPQPRPVWQHPGLIITLLVLFPPAGILLVWLSDWERQKKITATIISALWFVIILVIGPSTDEEADDDARADPTPGTTSEATEAGRDDEVAVPDLLGRNLTVAFETAHDAGFEATSHDATEDDAGQWDNDNWTVCFQSPLAGTDAAPDTTIDLAVVRNGTPCPESDGLAVDYPQMLDVVGMSYIEASTIVTDMGVPDVSAHAAYLDVELPEEHDDWTVCFQDPAAGDQITAPADESVDLSLVETGTECPADESSTLHPDPLPDPDPDPDPGSLGGSGGSEDDDDGSVYYSNCDEAEAAGAAPLHRGDPGYRPELDRDGDGTACDS